MRNTRQFLAITLGVFALFGFPAFVPGQTVPIPPEINPEVLDCNPSKPSTPISGSFLTTPLLPCDRFVEAPFDLPNLQHGFDFYSWLTFIALSSPANGKTMGQDAQTKWETWKQLPELMVESGQTPKPWGIKTDAPLECGDRAKDGTLIIHMAEETFNQPFKSGPLIDQNGMYALFVILMNREMFEYVYFNNLYSKAGQRAFIQGQEKFNVPPNPPSDPNAPGPGVVNFPSGSFSSTTSKGRVGAIMLKASWKVLGSNDDPSKFHKTKALIYTPSSAQPKRVASCSKDPVTLGMIGFHVGHKTVNAQQWIWSTFEHVNNVPDQRDVDAKTASNRSSFNFFNPNCVAERCPVNQVPPKPWDPVLRPFPGGFKSQITRVIPVTDDAADLNKLFQDKLLKGTVWANYMLVSTQWPSDPPCARDFNPSRQVDPTCAPAPTYLANTTLETYSQGRTPIASSSCIACHNNATSLHLPATPSDFTFILEKAR